MIKCEVELELPEALHARPASMLVRLASRQPADVELSCEGRRANAKKILEVLRLGAKRRNVVRILTRGENAADALDQLAELVRGGFVSDALPESGTAAALGIAVGRASWMRAPDLEAPESLEAFGPISLHEDRERRKLRLRAAVARAEDEVARTIGELSPSEAQLFEPELDILDELLNSALAHAEIEVTAEAALDAAARSARTERSDLVRDAYARVRARLRGVDSTAPGVELRQAQGDRILVTDTLTPSLLIALPKSFCGVVASDHLGTGYTSHAAILARGRGLPLVFAPAHAVEAIAEDDTVVIESTAESCHFWVSPSAEFVAKAITRRDAWLLLLREGEDADEAEDADAAVTPASPGVSVRANIASQDERIPASADGIGLVRTELVFSVWPVWPAWSARPAQSARPAPPSEAEQAAVYGDLARRVSGRPCVVRLFDAGGDKPLAWLPSPPAEPELRGIALLLAHPHILAAQLAALEHARAAFDVRILIPMVRSAADVAAVRSGLRSHAPVGAMIESADAARDIDAIADAADFISIGTNDLAASVLGVDRTRELAAPEAAPESLLSVIHFVIERAHTRGLHVTVCGELAGDLEGARRLVQMGVDALSVTPGRIASLKLALARKSTL